MLHTIPDSPYRDRLMEVVDLQRTLITELCSLPPGATVDLCWLTAKWSSVNDANWLRDFWEKENGVRADWCNVIAASPPAIKDEVVGFMNEQFRFNELYADQVTFRLTVQSWRVRKRSRGCDRDRETVMSAVNGLLGAFYDPLFYESSGYGYPDQPNGRFNKNHFLGRPKICPYSDNKIHDAKLDHFLPKESFPFLSCHPDNLIPCGTDPNSVARKGRRIPLQFKETDQAKEWFHPRLRSAKDKYDLTFDTISKSGPQVRFVARDADDQPRLDHMARMFGLVDFWSRDLDDELQLISGEIRDTLVSEGRPTNNTEIRRCLEGRLSLTRGRVGHDALAIVTAAFYEHVLNTPSYFSQVVRTCQVGT